MTTSRLSMLVAAAVLAVDLVPAQESRAVPATPLVAPASRPASRPKRAELYDTKTDGRVLVTKALEKAAKLEKRVLLVFGGNWCGWCHKLHDHFAKERAIAKILFNEYEVAWIDVGDANTKRNEELVAGYVEKLEGVPYLTVLDSAGKVLTNQETLGMLRKVKNRMTDEQLVELEAALRKFTGKPETRR